MEERTIMIVDDEKDIRDSVKTLLESKGYKVITAVDGSDCLKKLEGTKVDLVLMDIIMPGIPVKEVIPKIKTKVIYVSVVGTSEAEKSELLSSNNVVDYIQKPFDAKLLVKRIKKILVK